MPFIASMICLNDSARPSLEHTSETLRYTVPTHVDKDLPNGSAFIAQAHPQRVVQSYISFCSAILKETGCYEIIMIEVPEKLNLLNNCCRRAKTRIVVHLDRKDNLEARDSFGPSPSTSSNSWMLARFLSSLRFAPS